MRSSPKQHLPAHPRGILGRISLALVTTALSLLVVEGVLRLIYPSQGSIRFDQSHAIGQEKYRGEWEAFFEHDPELFWRLAPGQRSSQTEGPFIGLVSNSQGLREDHEISIIKPRNTVRILFLGDSVTFGFLLPHEENFPEHVERNLQTIFPELTIESINAGVPGYTLFQGWRYLVSEGMRFEPDIIVASFGWNGGQSWDGTSDPEQYMAQRRARPPDVLQNSRIAQLIWRNLFYSPPTSSTRDNAPRLTQKQFDELLQKLKQRSDTAGIELAILVPPGRFNINGDRDSLTSVPLHWVSRKRAQAWASEPKSATHFIDGVATARRLVAEGYETDDLLIDDVHTTPVMNQALAIDIAKKLAPQIQARNHHVPD